MNYEGDAIYGGVQNTSYMGADMMNPAYAQAETDWNAVLTNGIRGATAGALSALVGEKFASGQLQYQYPVARPGMQANGLMPILVIGGLLYVLTKG
jgi:hypothetical protein